jgi:hypothetical protein
MFVGLEYKTEFDFVKSIAWTETSKDSSTGVPVTLVEKKSLPVLLQRHVPTSEEYYLPLFP